jgi:tetratricopeptide (TPR) repeat protein
MGETDSDEIRRLMAEGLDHYALGQADAAVACWRRVLEIQCDHEEARDYLRAAEVDVDPLTAAEAVSASENVTAPSGEVGGPATLVSEAISLLRTGEFEEAIDLLETAGGDDADALDTHAYLELARSRLVRVYRDRVGPEDHVPVLRISPAETLKFNLPAQAGFLLSLVDGATSTRELLDLSGMGPFEGLRALSSLLDAGILQVPA